MIVEKTIMQSLQSPTNVKFISTSADPAPILVKGSGIRTFVEKGDVLEFTRPAPPPGKMARVVFFLPDGIFFFVLTNVLSSAFLLVLLGGFIYLSFMHLKTMGEKKSLENANLQAELRLLKSQVNPHFLFNTLNGIYSQVYHRSNNAELSILKLSEILRYVIYDSSTEMTSLEKDLHYLSNYVDLQRLRLADKVTVNYSIEGDCKDLKIAPLLLITFIENAFKHGISYTHPSVITISLKIFDKTLAMMVNNPIAGDNSFEASGIGLKNVKRRLDLLYFGNYFLDVVQDKNLYLVNLRINLNHD
jgi:LytS/YehU family sensor histidine kinase